PCTHSFPSSIYTLSLHDALPIFYRATQWYANELTRLGVKIYIYEDGFLHAKTTIVDDHFSSVGSINQDFRSYNLNFEDNAVFYRSEEHTSELQSRFDLVCRVLLE